MGRGEDSSMDENQVSTMQFRTQHTYLGGSLLARATLLGDLLGGLQVEAT